VAIKLLGRKGPRLGKTRLGAARSFIAPLMEKKKDRCVWLAQRSLLTTERLGDRWDGLTTRQLVI